MKDPTRKTNTTGRRTFHIPLEIGNNLVRLVNRKKRDVNWRRWRLSVGGTLSCCSRLSSHVRFTGSSTFLDPDQVLGRNSNPPTTQRQLPEPERTSGK